MKQYEEEWQIAMDNVEKAAGIVGSIVESCKQYNLKEKDLPTGLSKCFRSLQKYVMNSNDRFHCLIVPQ